MKLLRIATRQSPLALWQAKSIGHQLASLYPEIKIELVAMTTEGDKQLSTSLSKIGGKGLFVKALESALLSGHADIAVHSMKDVPAELPEDLIIGAICKREDPRDAFVSNHYSSLEALPVGATIGTSSLRRAAQLKYVRSDLNIISLRGNVNTRLQRLDSGDFSAIILAAAGLSRLGLADRIKQYLTTEICLPAVAQGALGIECCKENTEVLEMLTPLIHKETQICISAEREMNRVLEGGCQIPIAAHAILSNQSLICDGLVGQPDGQLVLRARQEGDINNAIEIGARLAHTLLEKGARAIIKACQTSC